MLPKSINRKSVLLLGPNSSLLKESRRSWGVLAYCERKVCAELAVNRDGLKAVFKKVTFLECSPRRAFR